MKASLIAYIQVLKRQVLIIQSVVARQWLKLCVPNFHWL